MEQSTPLVSVIIPYNNATNTIARTLQSIAGSSYTNYEVITVDDRSDDDSSNVVLKYPGTHLSMIRRSGAAMARNEGVKASVGDILFFVDADVTIQESTIKEIVSTFRNNPDISACFGEYTPLPHGDNFPTIFKNLVHHFTHQNSSERAHTFWCGCGAILRDAFLQVSGFDESFLAASVEDIDLGYRLSENGMRILLNKRLRVTHGKQYTFTSLIKSDVFNRAIPWTKLMASKNIFVADLNLKWNNILSALMIFILPPLFFAAGVSFGWERIWWTPILLVVAYIILNAKIIGFVIKQKGFLFSIAFFLMYSFTYVYSSIGFAMGVAAFIKDKLLGKDKKK